MKVNRSIRIRPPTHPLRPGRRAPAWARLPDQHLLDLRLCDLGLSIKGTVLQARIQQLYQEFARRNLRFRPRCWLSSEWFSPVGVPGIAIPFYLAHPRLRKLEARQMRDVEGGTKTWCMQLLRHEAGHAIETAYRLNRRARWRQVFGRSSEPYPAYYSPKPSSKSFVLHLDWWYAQSHPCEDFAETFAVWLTPRSQWRKLYQGWPALAKLDYVDELMSQIAVMSPPVNSRVHVGPLRHVRRTLRQHYRERRARYRAEYPPSYDHNLHRLFSDSPEHSTLPLASSFLRSTAPELLQLAGSRTPGHAYTVNFVLKDMISRCRQLNLRVSRPPSEIKHQAATLLATETAAYLHSDHSLTV